MNESCYFDSFLSMDHQDCQLISDQIPKREAIHRQKIIHRNYSSKHIRETAALNAILFSFKYVVALYVVADEKPSN